MLVLQRAWTHAYLDDYAYIFGRQGTTELHRHTPQEWKLTKLKSIPLRALWPELCDIAKRTFIQVRTRKVHTGAFTDMGSQSANFKTILYMYYVLP